MKKIVAMLALAAGAMAATPAMATITYNANTIEWNSSSSTPGSIGGNSQQGGGFAVNDSPIELALRASQYGNGIGNVGISGANYIVQAGAAPTNPGRFWWSFDFDINTGTAPLSTYNYKLELDSDASSNENWNDISTALYGSNNYVNPPLPATQNPKVGGPNASLLQDSSNLAFYPGFLGVDPLANGEYSIRLTATNATNSSISESVLIHVIVNGGTGPVVPEPATMSLVALGMSGAAFLRRRRAMKA